MLIIILSIIVLFVIAFVAFFALAPLVGKIPDGEDLAKIKKSPQHNGEIFINEITTNEAKFSEAIKTLPNFIYNKNGTPDKPLINKYSNSDNSKTDSTCFVTWYGHSAFLIEMAGKRVLLDPMLGESANPLYFTTKRFPNQDTIPIGELTDIDAVVFSHDHDDHLDYPTIKQIKNQIKHFFVPLGLGSHLKFWGVEESKITELDWWQKSRIENIEFTLCPARHFSGRGVTGRNTTLWGSWVLKSDSHNIYFSGDGGYGLHFMEIGDKFGPFDFAMIECGQYNEAWHDIHMMPEESAQAGADLNSEVLMPIHWGAFQLSVHSWDEPVKRFLKKASELQKITITPVIGERFEIGKDFPSNNWWE